MNVCGWRTSIAKLKNLVLATKKCQRNAQFFIITASQQLPEFLGLKLAEKLKGHEAVALAFNEFRYDTVLDLGHSRLSD